MKFSINGPWKNTRKTEFLVDFRKMLQTASIGLQQKFLVFL